MGRRATPAPEEPGRPGCLSFLLIFSAVCVILSAFLSPWILLGLGLPAGLLWARLRDRRFLSRCERELRQEGFQGILVTSDSPHWKTYIDERWLPRLKGRLQVLNWSQHRQWPPSTAAALFTRLVGHHENYCPSIVLLRGARDPLIFRFFHAFRDARHGNRAALEMLEARLWEEMDDPTRAGGVSVARK